MKNIGIDIKKLHSNNSYLIGYGYEYIAAYDTEKECNDRINSLKNLELFLAVYCSNNSLKLIDFIMDLKDNDFKLITKNISDINNIQYLYNLRLLYKIKYNLLKA